MIRWFRVVAHAMVAGTLAVALFATMATGAEEDDALKVFGYITTAQATPITIEYNQPSFGVPATPTFEMRFMHAESTADNGPSARALSSVFWPGDLAGNAPPSLLVDTFVPTDLIAETEAENQAWTAFRDGLAAGLADAPPYPIRSEAFYPSGASNETNLGGGVRMAASAHERNASASTTGSRSEFPGLFAAGHMNASTFTGIRDGIAVSEARAEVKDLSLFGGVIRLGSFRSTRTVVSDGEKATLEGKVDISSLVIDDTPVFAVTSDGPAFGDQTIPWAQAMQAIGRLEERGITVRLLEEDRERKAASARSRVSGIEIEMNSVAMGEFVDQFPEPLRTLIRDPGSSALAPLWNQLPPDLTGFANAITAFDHSITIKIGDVRVNGNASPPFTFELPPTGGNGGFPPPAPIDPGAGFPGTSIPPQQPPSTPPGNGNGDFSPTITPVATSGIPTGFAVFVFFLAAAVAGGLRALADRATAPIAAAGVRCTLEG